METLQAQLDAVNAQIAEEQAKGPQKDADILAGLEQKQAVILMNMDEAKTQEEQQAAQLVRIQEQEVKREGYTLPTDLNAFFSNDSYLNADGEPFVVISANKIVLQIVKDALTENDAEHNAKYADLEAKYSNDTASLRAERDSYKKDAEDQTQLIENLRLQLSQAIIERDDAFSKRDAALEEKKQREAQESADLSKMIADEQAEKERKAAEDRAKRTVYDVVPDSDINPKNYTAKLASTGETITYNWTQQKFYTVLTDEAEVERFRAEHAQQSPVPDSTLDTPNEIQPVPEVTAPDVQFPVDAGTIQEKVQVADGNSAAPVAGETVTRAEFEALKAIVKECAHVCDVNIAEVA